MRVKETFYSIQGEGVHAGLPTAFVRLAGCNLYPDKVCRWCDTKYAQAMDGDERTPKSVYEEIQSIRNYPWVCLTGGEPLVQEKDLWLLANMLRRNPVEVFTNGSLNPPSWTSDVQSWVVDVKTPSSGVCGVTQMDKWLDRMRSRDQLKFTVADKEDLAFVSETLGKDKKVPAIIISPVILGDALANLDLGLDWWHEVVEFCKKNNYRFSLQLHKVLYGNKAGV